MSVVDPDNLTGLAQTVPPRIDSAGRQLVNDEHPESLGATHNEAGAAAHHELVAAPGNGLRLVITRVMMSTGAAAGTIAFEQDTAGAPVQRGPLCYLPINSGPRGEEVYWLLPEMTNFGWTAAGGIGAHSVAVEYYVEAV